MKIVKFPKIWRIFIALLITVISGGVISVFAQSGQIQLIIDEPVDLALFPQLSTSATVFDPQGFLIEDATNFSATIDGAPVQEISSTQTFEQPLDIALVVDLSNTMGFGRPTPTIDNVIRAAIDFVGMLGPSDQVAVIGFSNLVFIAQELTPDKDLVSAALKSLETQGNTALNDAIINAVDLFEGSANRPVLILITDGVDSGISQASFQEAVTAAYQAAIPVYPVGWGAAKSDDLQQLADQTHGQLNYLPGHPPEIEAFQTAFGNITNSITRHRLEYEIIISSSLAKDGLSHQLDLTIDNLGRQAQATTTFLAPPPDLLELTLDYQPNQEVGGNVKFAPRFSPEIPPVQSLQILINGKELYTVSNPPFEYIWNSTSVPTGVYTFTLIAQNSEVSSAPYLIPLKVVDPIQAKIANPKTGETLSRATLITVEVKSLAPVAKVEFLLDGKSFGYDDQAPYEANWKVQVTAPGLHELTAIATDINGFTSKDQIKVNIGANEGGGGGWGLVLALVLGAAVLVIIFALRRRKRRPKTPAGIYQEGASGSDFIPGTESIPSASAILFEIEGLNPNRKWPLSQMDEVRLGRKRDLNDIPLMGGTASRQHAVIRYQQGSYIIFNVKPENPILINNQAMHQEYILQSDDVIQIGESIFRYQISG